MGYLGRTGALRRGKLKGRGRQAAVSAPAALAGRGRQQGQRHRPRPCRTRGVWGQSPQAGRPWMAGHHEPAHAGRRCISGGRCDAGHPHCRGNRRSRWGRVSRRNRAGYCRQSPGVADASRPRPTGVGAGSRNRAAQRVRPRLGGYGGRQPPVGAAERTAALAHGMA